MMNILDGIRKVAGSSLILTAREGINEGDLDSWDDDLEKGIRFSPSVDYHYLAQGKYQAPDLHMPRKYLRGTKTVPGMLSENSATYIPAKVADSYIKNYDEIFSKRIVDNASKYGQDPGEALNEHKRVLAWMRKHKNKGFSIGL